EVPIIFIDRKIGVSKMSGRILKEGVLGVLMMEFESLFRNYRKRMKIAPNPNFSQPLMTEPNN
ncbi:MAG TPA: hypothetical protein VGG71_07545, partial [Chitinophagaceae bacterium]